MKIVNEYHLLSPIEKSVLLTMHNEESSEGVETSHCHPNMEIIFVTDGEGMIMINNDNIVNISSGDVLVFDSMQSHQLFYTGNIGEFKILSVNFNIRNFVTDEFKVFGKGDMDRFFMELYNSNCIVPAESEVAALIGEILYKMHEKLQYKKQPMYVIRAQLLYILTLILEYYDQNLTLCTKKKPNLNTHIEKTIIYINQHINEKLTLEELASVANMGKSYYSTIFKKVTGKTVWEYILNMRIELAISYMMMNESNYNISEIAQLCGFNTVANFNKAFKRIVGSTPREYRNSKDSECFSK